MGVKERAISFLIDLAEWVEDRIVVYREVDGDNFYISLVFEPIYGREFALLPPTQLYNHNLINYEISMTNKYITVSWSLNNKLIKERTERVENVDFVVDAVRKAYEIVAVIENTQLGKLGFVKIGRNIWLAQLNDFRDYDIYDVFAIARRPEGPWKPLPPQPVVPVLS